MGKHARVQATLPSDSDEENEEPRKRIKSAKQKTIGQSKFSICQLHYLAYLFTVSDTNQSAADLRAAQAKVKCLQKQLAKSMNDKKI